MKSNAKRRVKSVTAYKPISTNTEPSALPVTAQVGRVRQEDQLVSNLLARYAMREMEQVTLSYVTLQRLSSNEPSNS